MAWGYTVGDILNIWAQQGIFAYVLPFLIIFSIVFAILSKTKILGDNKGVQTTIALAVGLIALQFDYVTNFYATIFPYTGVAISVLLVAIILTGLIGDKKDLSWWWFGLGLVLFIIVMFVTFSEYSWVGGLFMWANAWPAIVSGLIIVALIFFIVKWSK